MTTAFVSLRMVEKKPRVRRGPALRTLGRYELISRLAVGGMAEVFLARQRGIGDFRKLVVVKAIHPHLSNDSQFIHMLLDEARISALIKHPNVVDIYDLGNEDNRFFIALEYLAGQSLAEIIKAGCKTRKLDVYSSLRIIADVAGGLAAAHSLTDLTGERLELVHRDVSPANIMVTYDGGVKLLDFGVAKAVSARLSSTAENSIKGKVGYMSPEQIDGQPVDRRSDIFSLGVVMWELLSHKRLYSQDGPREVLREMRVQPWVPPSAFRPELPPDVDEICRRALAPSPAQRYQSASDIKKDLEIVLRAANYHRDSKAISVFMDDMFSERRKEQRALVRAAALGTSQLQVVEAPEAAPREPVEGLRVVDTTSMLESEVDAGESERADTSPFSGREDTEVSDTEPSGSRRDTEVTPMADLGSDSMPGSDTDPDATFTVDPLEIPGARAKARRRIALIVAAIAVCGLALALVIGLSGSDLETTGEAPQASTPEVSPGAVPSGTAPAEATEPAPKDETAEPPPVVEPEPSSDPAAEPTVPAPSIPDRAPTPPATETKSAAPEPFEGKPEPEVATKDPATAPGSDSTEATAGAGDSGAGSEDSAPPPDEQRPDNKPPDKKAPQQSRKQRRAAARRAYKEALKLLPSGRLSAAKKKLRAVLALSPGYAPAHRALGIVYQKQGKKSRAVRAYKKYLDLAPKAKDADAIRRRIGSLGG